MQTLEEEQLDFLVVPPSTVPPSSTSSPDLLGAVSVTSEQSPAHQQGDTDGGEVADSFIEDSVGGDSSSSEEEEGEMGAVNAL